MTIQQSRVPAGIPTGGQFAASQHAESSIALEDVEYGSAYYEDETPDFGAEIARLAYDSARHWEQYKGANDRSRGVVETDDVAQEAVLALLEAQANGHVINEPQGYMHRAAYNVAARAGSAVRAENRKALGLHRLACSKREAELGRSLTSIEEDEIAAKIRDEWPDKRHRPSPDFRRYAGQMEVSMDACETGEVRDALLPKTSLIPTQGVNDVTPDGYMDRALNAVEGHEGDLRDARRLLWNALAEVSDAPPVQAGTMSQRKVTAARALMGEHPGGVQAAIEAWENGENSAVTEALFAPWGEADDRTRNEVASMFGRHPDRVDDLWDSALKLANTRFSDRA